MEDKFTQTLFTMALDNPDLQHAIISSMSKDKGYSIPTGDITLSVFGMEEGTTQDKLIQAIHTARDLRVKDLAKILGELRVALMLEEVEGEKLSPSEETLRAIDITALATIALIKWLAKVKHEDRS